MTTDEERREVARRLRDDLKDAKSRGHYCVDSETVRYLCKVLGLRCSRCLQPWRCLEVLADLIEPDDPPYNLYTLYEAVFHRSPRCWECIEDDKVDELVDALLDICNAPGHEVIQRPQSSEPEVRCVAEVKIDGERLERLVHDAAVELTGIDRDALLALADEMEYDADAENAAKCDPMLGSIARMQVKYANRIREALGEGA